MPNVEVNDTLMNIELTDTLTNMGPAGALAYHKPVFFLFLLIENLAEIGEKVLVRGLENRCTGNRTVSSNLICSAKNG